MKIFLNIKFHCTIGQWDAQVDLLYIIDQDWKWTWHRLSVTHNEDCFPQATGIIVCRELQGMLGKPVWKTKGFLIAADMNELSETTAVSWDYITRHVSWIRSILVKRQNQRSLLLLLEKKILKAKMPSSSSSRMWQLDVYRSKLRINQCTLDRCLKKFMQTVWASLKNKLARLSWS